MRTRSIAFWLGCIGLSSAAGCGQGRTDDAELVSAQSKLTAAGLRIIGFESPAADWSLQPPATGLPPITSSTTHTQGSVALAVRARGFTPIKSAAFAVTKPIVGPIGFDIQLPTQQPNPSWFGTAQLILDCPSRGVSGAFLGQKELTGRPLGQFVNLAFDVAAYPANQLANGCADLRLTIVVNVAPNATGTYLLDNLTFRGSETVTPFVTCVARLSGDAGSPNSHPAALFGYDSSAPADVTIPVGDRNRFVPGADQAQPRVFHPGRHPEELAISFGEDGLSWQLDGATAVAAQTSPACSPEQTTRVRDLRQAQRVVQALRGVGDPVTRQYASALTLNALSAMGRVTAGQVGDGVEERIAAFLNSRTVGERAVAARTARALTLIAPEVRAELLGPTFASTDPGDGTDPSDWAALGVPTSNINPRLRTDFCALPNTDVTVGAMVTHLDADGDPLRGTALPKAAPVILGLQRNTVVAPHPVLISDHDVNQANGSTDEGNGFSAAGVATTLPCPCDATQGLICSSALGLPGDTRCVAVPIVTQGKDFTLRGHNFWDQETAGILLTPIGGGTNGGVGTLIAHESGVDSTGGARDCAAASRANPTHDTITFRTNVTSGFYRLRLFNQNGTYRLHGEAPNGPGRTVHVCWNLESGVAVPPEPTTNLSCSPGALAGETCAADGAACPASAWSAAPRALADCQGSFLDPPRCGETPAWIGSDPSLDGQSVVYIQGGDATFEIEVLRQSVEAAEESGWDALGEDETQVIMVAFTDREAKNGLNSRKAIEDHGRALGPDDYDSGDRRVFMPPTPLVKLGAVGQDEAIAFGLMFLEKDDNDLAIITGVLASIAVYGVCAALFDTLLPPPQCLAIGAAAIVAPLVALAAAEAADDNMGIMTWSGTPRQIADRVAITHAADFLPNYTAYDVSPGALPTTNAIVDGISRSRLMHPFVIDRDLTRIPPGYGSSARPPVPGRNLPETQCNPGTCAAGQVCNVNRCVPAGTFVDETAGIGFREQRDIDHDDNDSHYGVDLLYFRRQCTAAATTTPPPSQVVCGN